MPGVAVPSNVEILCGWAWSKVRLEREPSTETIHEYQRWCRLKRKLEAANPDQLTPPNESK